MEDNPNHVARETLHGNTWVSALVFNALANMSDDLAEKVYSLTKEKGYTEIYLTINGREIPFKPFLQRLEKSFDEETLRAAKTLVESRASDVLREIDELHGVIKRAVASKFPEFVDDDIDY